MQSATFRFFFYNLNKQAKRVHCIIQISNKDIEFRSLITKNKE